MATFRPFYRFAFFILLLIPFAAMTQSVLDLRFVGRYTTGVFDKGATEIAAYDPATARLFSVNGSTGNIDIIHITNPANPVLYKTIDLSSFGGGANSVAFKNGFLVAAVQADLKQNNGKAVFFDAEGEMVSFVEVGALPDMITFSPDGKKVLTANEGEPNIDYSVDPLGTVSIIDISGGIHSLTQNHVTTIDFSAYNNAIPAGVRVFGPNASLAQDVEPEYIAVSPDSKKAFVTLQENNAIACIDLKTNRIDYLKSLGVKNHNIPGNGLDASDRNNNKIKIANWPLYGLYQPDAIAAFSSGGKTFTITANEGDVREYETYVENVRVKDITLDATAFPNAQMLRNDSSIGRLNISKASGDYDNDGDYDALYSFGSRSFSIFDEAGHIIFDSGDFLEQYFATNYPDYFNCSNTNNTKKNRSDDKGPEPEGVIVATILDSTFAFIGIERIGGVIAFNITNPYAPYFVDYIQTRDFSETPGALSGGDLGAEGLLFIPASESPNGKNLLVVSYEVSGSISIYETDHTCGDRKVAVCHRNKSICVSSNALPALLAQGAEIGRCSYAGKTDEFSFSEGNETESLPVSHQVYPNPSSGMFDLRIENLSGDIHVRIYSFDGRLVAQQSAVASDKGTPSLIAFDSSEWASGLYLYEIGDNQFTASGTGKFQIVK